MEQRITAASNAFKTKLILTVAIACFACVSAVFGAYIWIDSDVKRLRADQLQLQENIKQLEAVNGRVKVSYCDGQLCVRVDPNRKPYTENSTGLPMYFVK